MNSEMTNITIIADSSPLIALAVIGQLTLLPRLYTHILIPPAVWEEVTIQGSGLPGALEVSQATWLSIQSPPSQLVTSLHLLIDKGEAEAIALALTLPDCTVLLDDARARRVAEHFNLKRIGTVGLLCRAKKLGLISQLKPLLDTLRTHGIYIQQQLIDSVLREAGE